MKSKENIMKSIKKIAVAFALIATCTLIAENKSQAQAAVNFQVFYDQLSPYGQWVDDPQYGYVWIPAGAAGFSPYETAGHWVLTDYGWTWVSDYPWGWAPFHYGRWHYGAYGWLWVPGHEWGPAWVSWRRARGYYGWAPLEPGISLQVAFGPRYSIPHERWVFVQERYISNPHLTTYYTPRRENGTIIQNSTVINNTYVDNGHHTTVVSGPRREEVQKITGSEIKPVVIKESSKPAQSLNKNELDIYRPVVQKNDAGGVKPAPRKVANIKDIKPAPAADVNNSSAGHLAKQPSDAGLNKNDQKTSQPSEKKELAPASHDAPVNQQQPDKVTPKNNNAPPPNMGHNERSIHQRKAPPHHNSIKQAQPARPKEEKRDH
ncbi:MAG: DUF6600 domain-containing protein [Bacteroidota bacterium]